MCEPAEETAVVVRLPENTFERNGEVTVTTIINPAPPGDTMTVPIIGVPRSGTTMVAAVVDALGIYLGPREELEADHFEDATMRNDSFEERMWCVQRRNETHQAWGWKDPAGSRSLVALLYALRNPRPIIVFRDIVAVIQAEMRNDAAIGVCPARPFRGLLKQTLERWQHIGEFLDVVQSPVLLVSYERAINNREMFVEELAGFLGLAPDEQSRADAVARINPTGGYLVPQPVAGGT
jgi:hypothetical protein